jgi:hypothetical protein
MNHRLIIATVTAALAFGCTESDSGPATPKAAPQVDETATLSLQATTAAIDGQLTAQLRFTRTADEGPRIAEIWLRHSPDVVFLSATAGDATSRVQKQLVAQVQDDGMVRLIVFSAQNTERIDSGNLANITFSVVSDGPAQIEIVDKMPVFAPPPSNAGLLLGAPISLREAVR